jgi:hypothetical protein
MELRVIWSDIWAYRELYRRGKLCTTIIRAITGLSGGILG